MTKQELRRELGLWGAVAVVVGTVIGSGIFAVPKAMVLHAGSPAWVFFVWVFGGVLSLFGALTYAELAAAMPEAGGEYAYLRTAYGPFFRIHVRLDSGLGSEKRINRNAWRRYFSIIWLLLRPASKSCSLRFLCRSAPVAGRWRSAGVNLPLWP